MLLYIQLLLDPINETRRHEVVRIVALFAFSVILVLNGMSDFTWYEICSLCAESPRFVSAVAMPASALSSSMYR